ncbi:MAG: stage 0 sporulation protein [Ruminococcaceae bacterium]|nr:stage 0 sporulation protein [Oscillospiraceae bacterium]
MIEIIGVRFKRTGKIYYFDPAGLQFRKGDRVVVETSRGIELCEVWLDNRQVEEEELVQPLRKVIRAATEEDLAAVSRNEERAKEAFAVCEKKIAAHNLEMKLIEAEYAFDGSKLLFYFTADGRVDFRDLVKDLASVFRIRIELRQIGVRDEAKMYGGLGVCGRPLCCASFLDDFHPVSIKMAKEQGLSLNPTKISGNCSRLMCCLKYEQEAYEDLLRRCPKVDTVVQTPAGIGTIMEVNLLKQQCKVRYDKPGELPKVFSVSELRPVKSAGSRQNHPPREGDRHHEE